MKVVKNQPKNDEAEQQQTHDSTNLNISWNVSLLCTDFPRLCQSMENQLASDVVVQ